MSTPFVGLRLDEAAGPTAADVRNDTPLRTVTSARAVLDSDGGANADGCLVRCQNGDVLAIYTKGATRSSSDSKLYYRRCLSAADPTNPANYGAATLIANHTADSPINHIMGSSGCTLLSTGRLVLMYDLIDATADPSDGNTHNHLWTRYSDDNGLTWSSGYLITQAIHGFDYDFTSHYGAPFELADNSVLLPMYGANSVEDIASGAQQSTTPTGWYVNLAKSTDHGATWTFFVTAIPRTDDIIYSEARIVRLVDDRLQMLIRSHRYIGGPVNTLFGSISADEGATWSPPFVEFDGGSGLNGPVVTPALVNTNHLVILQRGVNTGNNSYPPILVETADDGVRWSIRNTLHDDTGLQSLGGGIIPNGVGRILILSFEGTPLAESDAVLYEYSAPTSRTNGDNPGTAVGDVTFNQGALLTGTASASVFTTGYIECPTSPVTESVVYGDTPGISFECEFKLTETANFTDYFLGEFLGNSLPSGVFQVYIASQFGTKLKLAVGKNGNILWVSAATFAFSTGVAYKVRVILDNLTVRMWVGTDPNTLVEQTVTTESGAPPGHLYDTAFGLIKLRVGNNINRDAPLKGQIANVAIAGLPQIITEDVPDGRNGDVYFANFVARGGIPDYTWSVSAGSLPTGLTLDAAAGEITGTPTVDGVFTFTIRATDENGSTDDLAISLTLDPPEPPVIITTTLPHGRRNAGYSQAVTAEGGALDYTWSVTTGALPSGLAIIALTGVISGTPTLAETQTFTVRVVGSNGGSDSQALTLEVTAGNSLPGVPSWYRR